MSSEVSGVTTLRPPQAIANFLATLESHRTVLVRDRTAAVAALRLPSAGEVVPPFPGVAEHIPPTHTVLQEEVVLERVQAAVGSKRRHTDIPEGDAERARKRTRSKDKEEEVGTRLPASDLLRENDELRKKVVFLSRGGRVVSEKSQEIMDQMKIRIRILEKQNVFLSMLAGKSMVELSMLRGEKAGLLSRLEDMEARVRERNVSQASIRHSSIRSLLHWLENAPRTVNPRDLYI